MQNHHSESTSSSSYRVLNPDEKTASIAQIFRLPSAPFGLIAVVGLVFLVVSMATRCVLLLQSSADVDMAAVALARTFATGLFYDAVAFSYFMAPLAAYLAFAPQAVFISRIPRLLLYGFIIALFALLVFTASAEYLFWQEFETRFDFVAVDYLVYQREVTENIRQSYPLGIILPVIGVTALLFFAAMKRTIDRCLRQPAPWRRRATAGCTLFLLPFISAIFITGSPTILVNRINNKLAMNGIYSFFEALYNGNIVYAEHYPTRNAQETSLRLRLAVNPENHGFIHQPGSAPDIWRTVEKSPEPETRPNVVIVVLESMSGEFLSALGGRKKLTPNLDGLAQQGLYFSALYATGKRTIRGLEAIALSVPPTPPESILKRPNNGDLFTIGTPFIDRGYDTSFFYGGHSYFDNMGHFFGDNGFRIIDRSDLSSDEVTFSTAWGVCDEDTFRRVVSEADASYQRGQKFFSLIMTVSNHRPFTYADGKIDIPSGEGRPGGVKYADFAVGELIKNASTRPWFDDTIFVFIADHCARSGGKNEINLENYRIPCIFYGPKIIKPGKVESLASQIDIAPTLFDLLNWQYESNFVGRSVFRSKDKRAFVSNHLTLGYLKDDMLITLKPGNEILSCTVDPVSQFEQVIAPQKDIIEEAITYYQGSSSMYVNMLRN